MLNYKDYNNLDKEQKDLFKQAHAPNSLKVGEVLVRKFTAKYNEHAKVWLMPSLEEMNHYNPITNPVTGEEYKVYKNFRYQNLNRKTLHWMDEQKKAGEKLGDNRGQYRDINGVVHRDVYKQGNFFLKIVTDLNEELELLSKLFIKAVAPEVAKVKEVKKEVVKEVSQKDKDIYSKWLESTPRLSKKEFAKQQGISTHILNRIIKDNE